MNNKLSIGLMLQVHITQGDYEGKSVIVSWVTPKKTGSNLVLYGKANDKHKLISALAKVTTYKYYNYTSGFIHHCTLNDLEVYIYIHICLQMLLLLMKTE